MFSLCWDRKEVIMAYEINLNTITDELVETYSRLLPNDVCIADTYRDRAIKDFKGTINLFVLTGRIEDDEKALRYIDILEDRLDDCRESFEKAYEDEVPWEEKSLDDMILCDYRGICAGESCPMYWKCQH